MTSLPGCAVTLIHCSDNALTARMEASSAVLEPATWILRGVKRWNLAIGEDDALGQPETLPELRLPPAPWLHVPSCRLRPLSWQAWCGRFIIRR